MNRSLCFQLSPEELPKGDLNARFLFEISSTLPSVMLERASAAGMKPKPYSKGFVYKAKLETMVQLLEIGTKADFMALEGFDEMEEETGERDRLYRQRRLMSRMMR